MQLQTEELTNSIWGVSATYNRDAHNLMLAYQDNAGNIGYDYGLQRMMVYKAFMYQTHTYPTLMVMMKNQLAYNITITLKTMVFQV